MNRNGIVIVSTGLLGAVLIIAAWLVIHWLTPPAPPPPRGVEPESPQVRLPAPLEAREAAPAQSPAGPTSPGGQSANTAAPDTQSSSPPAQHGDAAPGITPPDNADPDTQAGAPPEAAQLSVAVAKTQRMRNVRDVIVASYSLLDRLGGEWPADATGFAEVQAVGRVFDVIQGRAGQSRGIAGKLLALPTLVYRRPPHRMDDPEFDPQWVVFHDYIGDTFPPDGIAVGFADGHIEWITDEDAFAALLDANDDG